MDKSPEEIKIDRIEEILASHIERRSETMLENHAQTVIVFVILGVLSWVGYSILQTGEKIAQTNVSIEVLKNDVSYMKTALDKAASNHVSKNEFNIQTGQMQNDLADTKARLRLLEQNSGTIKPKK